MLTVRMLTAANADTEAALAMESERSPVYFTRPQKALAFSRLRKPPAQRMNAVWAGSEDALRALGLRWGAEVTARHLAAAIAGRHRDSGAPVRTGSEVADLAFIAPPSVSWLWSQAEQELRADLEDAVLNAGNLGVEHLIKDRPLAGGEPCWGHAVALVLHAVGALHTPKTSPPLPLLHAHVYLVGVLDSSGMLRSPQYAALHESSFTRLGGAVGRAVLAQDLNRLGFQVTGLTGHRGRSFEVTGVPEGLVKLGQEADKGCAGLGVETDPEQPPYYDGNS